MGTLGQKVSFLGLPEGVMSNILAFSACPRDLYALKLVNREMEERVEKTAGDLLLALNYHISNTNTNLVRMLSLVTDSIFLMGGKNSTYDDENSHAGCSRVDSMYFDSDSDCRWQWCSNHPQLLGRRRNATGVMRKSTLIIFGSSFRDCHDTYETLDVLTQDQAMYPLNIPTDIYEYTPVVFQDTVFLLGGVCEWAPIDTVYVLHFNDDLSVKSLTTSYDCATQLKLSIPKTAISAVEYRGCIYAAGGYHFSMDGEGIDYSYRRRYDLQVFEPSRSQSQSQADGANFVSVTTSRLLDHEMENIRLLVVDDELYSVFYDPDANGVGIEKLDYASLTWMPICPSTNGPRVETLKGFYAAKADKCIIVGGLDHWYSYSLKKKAWSARNHWPDGRNQCRGGLMVPS